jgi:hypothetical protein
MLNGTQRSSSLPVYTSARSSRSMWVLHHEFVTARSRAPERLGWWHHRLGVRRTKRPHAFRIGRRRDQFPARAAYLLLPLLPTGCLGTRQGLAAFKETPPRARLRREVSRRQRHLRHGERRREARVWHERAASAAQKTHDEPTHRHRTRRRPSPRCASTAPRAPTRPITPSSTRGVPSVPLTGG